MPTVPHRIASSSPASHPLTRRLLLGAGLVLASRPVLAGFNFFTGEYTATREELQKLIARRFPLVRGHGSLFNVRLSDPQLGLDATANRASITVHVAIQGALLPQPVEGQLVISSALHYDPATRALQLEQPHAERIVLEGVSGRDAERLQRIGAAVAQELLQGQVLRTFSAEELTIGFKTYEIGDITVREDGISVQLKSP